MINIFGLRIVTGKDLEEIQRGIAAIAYKQYELGKDIDVARYHTEMKVKNFMDFVMTRMPLKRHRKEAREHFPKSKTQCKP